MGYRDSLTPIDFKKALKEERNKEHEFPFVFEDEDIIEREASEIYSCYEIAEFKIDQAVFEELLNEDFSVSKWMQCVLDSRKQFVISLLDTLETHTAPETTEKTLRALMYVSQGVPDECDSPSHSADIRMASLNNGLLKQCCCYPILVQGLCRAAKRAAIQHLTAKKGNRPDLQVSLYLNIIFNLILFNQNDPSFAHEIESTRFEGSSLAVIILDLITEFNEQPDSPFPVKKLLLVLWKVLNTTLGSMTTLKKQKQDLLKTMGGVPTPTGLFSTKSRLEDFETLKRDAERHQHNIIYTTVFEMPDSAAHAKYLTIKRTKGLDFINNLNNNDNNDNNNNNNNNNTPDYPPLSPRPAHVDSPFIGAVKRDIPKRESDMPKLDLESKLFSEKYLRQTLRLPPALGEAFRIMEKNLYIPPATLQHPEFQQGLEALLSKKAPHAHTQAQTTLPRILQHPDSTTAFERIYRQILPNLANHLVFILKIMLAAAPTVKNYAGTINLNLEGPGPESQRHREIVLKVCTAILLLVLKHARFNSLQQFSHIRNIMIDAKAVLLMLKLINHDLNLHIATPADPDDICLFKPPAEPEILKNTYLPGSFRNFFSMTGVLRILQKLTKKNGVALRILHQYKAPAILKKTLETSHHSVRLYTLKVFKSLVPYLPRKWRAMNMKIVSEIYFYVRLDTRDDWLSGDPDLGSKDAQEAAQVEEFLRTQYIEWWQHMKHSPKDRIIYGMDEPLGMDPIQALLAKVELDDEWKNHWEEWVAWEERGSSYKENMFKVTP